MVLKRQKEKKIHRNNKKNYLIILVINNYFINFYLRITHFNDQKTSNVKKDHVFSKSLIEKR